MPALGSLNFVGNTWPLGEGVDGIVVLCECGTMDLVVRWRKSGKGCLWMLFLWRRGLRLVLLRWMRVTFGDDYGRVFDSMVGELVWRNGKVDGVDVEDVDLEVVVHLMSLPWLDLRFVTSKFKLFGSTKLGCPPSSPLQTRSLPSISNAFSRAKEAREDNDHRAHLYHCHVGCTPCCIGCV
jgi:hypothetical protein